MKLRYERFEGLSCFSIRETVSPTDLKVLEIGLETLCKDLHETLLVNLSLATVNDAAIPALGLIKKKLPSLTKQKIYWISKSKVIADFAAIELFTSRLTGFKSRQIGERIKLEDDIHQVQEQIKIAEAKIAAIGGDAARAQKIILENRIFKAQEQVLKNTIQYQVKRLKAQTKVPATDEEVHQKIDAALAEIKTYYGQDLPL